MEYRYRAPEPDHSLWWQIALGVFLALMAHSVITGLYEQHQMSRAMRQLSAETKRLEAQAQRQIEAAAAVASHPKYHYSEGISPPRALADGERCISGKRFQRVENGWVQLPREPC